MSAPLKIDFVSDVSCPWCVVGLYGLTRALDLLGDEVQAEIRFQPFELNPKMGPEGQNITEHITEKYGSTPEQSQKNREMIRARGAEVGFAFRTDGNSRIYNTFDAHRLLYCAGLEGLQLQLKEALFKDLTITDEAVRLAMESVAATLHVQRLRRWKAAITALMSLERCAGDNVVPLAAE